MVTSQSDPLKDVKLLFLSDSSCNWTLNQFLWLCNSCIYLSHRVLRKYPHCVDYCDCEWPQTTLYFIVDMRKLCLCYLPVHAELFDCGQSVIMQLKCQ